MVCRLLPLLLGAVAVQGCSDTKFGSYTCAQRKQWNTCDRYYMDGYCEKTCGRCTNGGNGNPSPNPNPAPKPGAGSEGTPGGMNGLAAGKKKFVGNIIGTHLQADYAKYWNQVTPENSAKWRSCEGQRDQMTWDQLDMAYKFAKDNKMPFKFHVLVWGNEHGYPTWMNGLPQNEQRAEVEEWMQLVAQRYPDIDMIDVVNEAQHVPAPFKDALGGDGATGWDWVIWSFQKARQYFPNAELHLNDYAIITGGKEMETHIRMANLLKDRGLIDALAFQAHKFSMEPVSVYDLKRNLDTLAATGLPLYVSELDFTGNEQQQKRFYEEKFPILYEHKAVKAITLWGYREGKIWIKGAGLLNADGSERAAMKWLRSYLAK